MQVARKVVGVGSVGQRAWVLLLEDDEREPHVPAGQAGAGVRSGRLLWTQRYRNQGERVVAGQHLMQAPSDIFLGWTHVVEPTESIRTTTSVS